MYQVKEQTNSKFRIYELVDTETNSWVKVAPERGGIIFSYGVEGKELLYLNEETFYRPDQNVRGGIPILFPISGQLPEKTYEWEGIAYTMNNHGFARNAVWEVVGFNTEDRASLMLRLTSNEKTKIAYPFDFELLFTYFLEKGKLTIHQEYRNMSGKQMPMYPGFHPYFRTNEKKLSYETNATRYLDYNDSQEKEFTGSIDLGDLKESVVLLDAEQPWIAFQPPGMSKQIKLSYGKEFKYVVLWSESGKDFVCVEPWMAKNDEFTQKEELVFVKENGSLKTEISINLEDL